MEDALLQGIQLLLVSGFLLFKGKLQQLQAAFQGFVVVDLFLGVAAQKVKHHSQEEDDDAEFEVAGVHW